MIKVFCDKCEQEITDVADVSAVVEDGVAMHYHKSACFTEARTRLTRISRTVEPAQREPST